MIQPITKKRGDLGEIITTEAPSPRTALSASPGTGSHEGRAMAFPKWLHISARRIGFGDVPLITPNSWMNETEFSMVEGRKEIS